MHVSTQLDGCEIEKPVFISSAKMQEDYLERNHKTKPYIRVKK